MRHVPWFIAATITAVVLGSSLVALQPDGGQTVLSSRALEVGTEVAPEQIHWINNPGRYGLGTVPAGDQYAVVSGNLVRIDANNGILRAILRPVTHLLD